MSSVDWKPFEDPSETESSIENVPSTSPRRRFGDLSGVLSDQPLAEVAGEVASDAAQAAASAASAVATTVANAVDEIQDAASAGRRIHLLQQDMQMQMQQIADNMNKIHDAIDKHAIHLREHDTTFEVHGNQLRRFMNSVISLEAQAGRTDHHAEPNEALARHR